MSKKTNDLLPIGTRVRVQDSHIGRVLGYGFEQDWRNSGVVTTVSLYIVHLDEGFWGEGRTIFVRVIAANPDNVKEAE